MTIFKKESTMKKLSFAFLWVGLVVFLAVGSVQSALGGTYSGGSGTADDPYLISTAEDMQSIGANPADWRRKTGDCRPVARLVEPKGLIGKNSEWFKLPQKTKK